MTEIADLNIEELSDEEVLDPFLPGTRIQYAWDSTSIGLGKACPRLYQYVMIEGWAPKDESVHLRFGREYHQALQDYESQRTDGLNHDEALHIVIRWLLERTKDFAPDPDTKAGKYKGREQLLQLVIDRIDHYKNDAAKTVQLPHEEKPACELSFKFELDWGPESQPETTRQMAMGDLISQEGGQPYLLCGHLDRVVSFNGALFVMDHKTTTSTIAEYYFNQYAPNNQMTLYSLAAKVIMEAPIKGVIIDAAQLLIEAPFNRFERGFTFRTPDQLDEWSRDLAYFLKEMEEYALADYWPMRDTSCDRFGGCVFRDVCSSAPQVRDRFLESKFTKLPLEDRWNPLKPR